MSVTLEDIKKAIEDRGEASDAAHAALKAEIMKAIPDDHLTAHKRIENFMGRMDSQTHLDHHEFIEPWRHTMGIIKDQVAKNVGNVLSVIVGLGGVIYLLKMVGVIAP